MPTRPLQKATTPALILPGRIIESAGKVLGKRRIEIKGRDQPAAPPPLRKIGRAPSAGSH